MKADELAALKKVQRNSQGMYKPEFFFPSESRKTGDNLTDSDRHNRLSLRRAQQFICLGVYGCKAGDCLAVIESSDVLQFRISTGQRRVGPTGKTFTMKELLTEDLQHCWNRTTELWEPLNVNLDEVVTIPLCPAAYGLLCGCAPSTLRNATETIKLSEIKGGQLDRPSLRSTAGSIREQRSEDWVLLRAYVADLVNRHEANPAPGAHQPGRITSITKSTWKAKWLAAETYFQNAPRMPGSKSMLKKAWKLETRLKEKKACSHSKCVTCSGIDKNMDAVRNVNTEEGMQARVFNARAQAEHDKLHLGSRTELDNAGLHAFVEPRSMWTLLADAATQRNFMLPKFQFRYPKNLAGRPFWSYKLMACYAYGYGFVPFLVHSSQTMGANLTWTVLWLTLSEMRKHYGFWPRTLHLTLDNTTGENKNETLLCMCAWLVASGKVAQVRVLFLMVGHTHVVIDHIFGVVTVGLRRKELLTPEDLEQNINASLAENPQYMAKPVRRLHCMWDFKNWCKQRMSPAHIERIFRGNIQDEVGSYNGMFDFLFSAGTTGTRLPRLKYREHFTHAWLPDASHGIEVIRSVPDSPPVFQEIKKWSVWSVDGSKNVKDTVLLCLSYARSTSTPMGKSIVLSAWEKHYSAIPDVIDLLRSDLKLTFEMFHDAPDDVLRIRDAGSAAGTDENNENDGDGYETWKRHNLDVRTHPLAIDPVVSSEQSSAEFNRKKLALQATIRDGHDHPTTLSTSPIFLGSYVLASIANDGVDLYSVANMDGMRNVYSADLTFTAVLHEHVPNPDVSGLFGTFRMKLTLQEGKRRQTRITLHRSQVVVFNAHLTRQTKVLTLRTLRALAMARQCYPFPERKDIPESHLELSDDEEGGDSSAGRSRRNAARRQPPGKGRGRAARGRGRPARGGAAPRMGVADSSDEDDDSEDDSDDDSDEDSDSLEHQGDGSSDDSSEESPDNSLNRRDAAVPRAATEQDEPAGLLTGPVVEVQLDKVIALNMEGDPEYTQYKYPVGIGYVCSIDPFKVRWFVLPTTQLAQAEAGRTAKPFKTSNKNLTFQKYYDNPSLFRRNNRPTEEQILDQWHTGHAERNWVLPVDVPQPDDRSRIRMSDRFKVPMQFVIDTLIPACEHASCVQSH